MISGTFHVMSQQWRYFSREKSIVHTLHVAQLLPTQSGDTIVIGVTPPVQANKSGGFSGGTSVQVPPIPAFGGGGVFIPPTGTIPCYALYNFINGFTQLQESKNATISFINDGTTATITAQVNEGGLFQVGAKSAVVGATPNSLAPNLNLILTVTANGQTVGLSNQIPPNDTVVSCVNCAITFASNQYTQVWGGLVRVAGNGGTLVATINVLGNVLNQAQFFLVKVAE